MSECTRCFLAGEDRVGREVEKQTETKIVHISSLVLCSGQSIHPLPPHQENGFGGRQFNKLEN